MSDKELMQQALMALEEGMTSKEWRELVKALRERLAQPEQELVCVCGAIWGGQELVSTPPPRQWQGLTDEERNNLWRDVIGWGDPSHDDEDLMKAIEAKLKEKNG
jgi:hypothetical protein